MFVRRWQIRRRGRPAFSSRLVEAAAGLASERALFDERSRSRSGIAGRSTRRSPSRRRGRRSRAAPAAPSAGRRPSSCSGRCLGGAGPSPASSSIASNRYGNSSRLTTKPGMSGTSTGVLPIATQSARERARVSSLASCGNTSSTSSIRGTGLNTCRPAKRSGRARTRPRARGSRATRSWWRSPRPRRPCRRAAVSKARSWRSGPRRPPRRGSVACSNASRSVTILTRSGSGLSGILPHVFATAARARSAERSERAHNITSPLRAATAASPVAMVPAPAIPKCLVQACSRFSMCPWSGHRVRQGDLHALGACLLRSAASQAKARARRGFAFGPAAAGP